MKTFLIPFLLFFTMVQNGFSQILEPVTWSFSQEKINDDEYYLVYTAIIDDGWTVYSQYTSDDGPVPTAINYESMAGIELIGDAEEFGKKKEGYDKLFDVDVIKFLSNEPFQIKQKVKVTDASAPISGYLTYMTCDDEKCLPPTDIDFSFTVYENNEEAQMNGASTDEESMTLSLNNDAPAILDPVQWTFTKNQLSENTYELEFKAQIEKGWNVYSQFMEEGGPIPTMITYENMEGVELVGEAIESGYKKEGADPLFPEVSNVIKFTSKEDFIIRQQIKVNDDSQPLTGYLTYMTCDDEKCLPPADVDFDFGFGSLAASDIGENIQGNTIDQRIPPLVTSFNDPIGSCGEVQEKNTGLLWTFVFGFIGGLLALLTPCVFPMIPITVSFFTKDTKRKGWMNGLIYGLSIIVIYVILGLLITILVGPEALNRLSTNWIANTIFFIIFIFFAFSFFGFYEITLPSSWSTKSDTMADKGGLLGIFFMAFTLALVSFSCTGPIIGTAIVQAATKGDILGPFLVMFGFSLALALPFGLFAAFPAWLNTLPRSGSWMTNVKVVLGFLELALAFKFLSVADMTNHWGFLKYELFMAIWIIVFVGMALYLFGFIKFPHDSPIKKLSLTRKVTGTLAAAFAIYLATGFGYNDNTKSYNALSLMSGLAPPANYNFFLPKPELDPNLAGQYMSYTKCANDIQCFKDYYEGIEYANKIGKPALIDFTGYGCVNCRKTEEHIWVDDKIRSILNDDLVLISLYVDDDKELTDTYVSALSGKKLRNVGNKWADFQIANFEQNSQPLYVLISPDQKVLAPPRGYREGIDGYLDYLECGLNTFEKTYLSMK